MSAKINIYGIVCDHIGTLRDDRTGKFAKIDLTTFFVFPAIIGSAAAYCDLSYSENFLLGGIAALSIFAGLLINVLVLIYTIGQASAPRENSISPQKTAEFIRQTFANISYAICNSLINVLMLYVLLFLFPRKIPLIVGATSFLFINFILTIFMVLKRIHAMIKISV